MNILEDVFTPFGRIKIIESRKDGTITYYQDEVFQSQADTKGTSTCGYIHIMADLLLQTAPKRVLLIGGAGGTLATLLHRAGCAVTLIDINPYAFTLARRYFQLPKQIRCIEADGYQYLMENDESFDAIAIDAFNGKGQIPRPLLSLKWFRLLSHTLPEEGLALMNIMTAHDLDMEPDRIAGTAQRAGLSVTLFDSIGQQHRNTLLAAGNVEGLATPRFDAPGWLKKEAAGLSRRLPRGAL